MFHVELRQFPGNFCRFNLTEGQLRTNILHPWARGEWIEMGERKWNPEQAKLTVLEGPEIPLNQLTMGRGWRTAQRQGHDVTERVLAEVHDAQVAAAPSNEPDLELQFDSLALEILADLGGEPAPLHRTWELAAGRSPDSLPSRSLALAEGAVLSLLRSGLIVLLVQEGEPAGRREIEQTAACEVLLRSPESWLQQAKILIAKG
jgi:hypothetical protein